MPGRSHFSRDEVARLVTAFEGISSRDRVLIVVGIKTGLRVSELYRAGSQG